MTKRKTRLVSLLLSAVMLLGVFAIPASAETTSKLLGDVDGDGVIAPRDAAIVARHLAGWEDYVDDQGNVTFPPALTAGFSVGYCKMDITPDLSYYKRMPLAGYGNTDTRFATGVPEGDGLFATCIAIKDEEGEIILLFSVDRINCTAFSDNARSSIARVTGVPEENISFTATHTHTAPDNSSTTVSGGYVSRYNLESIQKMVLAARRAINNLGEATMWAGDAATTNLNFVRRYFVWYSDTQALTYQTHTLIGDDYRYGYEGPNTADDGTVYLAHETEVDSEVQYIVFKRDGMQDVILYNWQCHPDQIGNGNFDLNADGSFHRQYLSGGTAPANKVVSADFINGARHVLEDNGYLSAYFQGPAGNINQSDNVNSKQNKQIGSDEFAQYRLAGVDVRYYTNCYNGTNTAKGYWKSQMLGSILADTVLKDIAKTPTAQTNTTTWTDNWVGMRRLETGKVRVTYSDYYSTYANNDADLQVTMSQLAGIAAGRIQLADTYTVTYSNDTYPVATMRQDIAEIKNLAAQYGRLTDIAQRKAFAWDVLNTYRARVNTAFSGGMAANGGSGGANNVEYKAARLLARLATGLYINNYYANQISSRNAHTDLTREYTDQTLYTDPVRLRVFSIGQSVAFCFAPYEMFDTIGQGLKDGKYIAYDKNGNAVTVTTGAEKEGNLTRDGKSVSYSSYFSYQAATYEYTDVKSPFQLTFVCGYSNESKGYMPTVYARTHAESHNNQNGYETYVTHYAIGTAEEHQEEFITLLNNLYVGNTTPRTSGHIY